MFGVYTVTAAAVLVAVRRNYGGSVEAFLDQVLARFGPCAEGALARASHTGRSESAAARVERGSATPSLSPRIESIATTTRGAS